MDNNDNNNDAEKWKFSVQIPLMAKVCGVLCIFESMSCLR